MGEPVEVAVEGRRVRLTNLDKVLYPAAGFTKAEVVDYYVRVADAMLPHLRDRCVTFRRFPNGVDGTSFFEKRCPSHRPGWVDTAAGPGDRGGPIQYCLIAERAGLAWAANLAALELHTPMARSVDLESPQMVVFDLDPGEGTTIVECAALALRIREMLDAIGLVCVAKTSGSKGMQVYVPLNAPHTHEQAADFALAVAQVAQGHTLPGLTLHPINPSAQPVSRAPLAVLGAGTGLGEALVAFHGDQPVILSTEGGHTDFAPHDEVELALWRFVAARFPDHVSQERLVCGPGIVTMYEFFCQQGQTPHSPQVSAEIRSASDPAQVISRHALQQTDPLCQQVMERFVMLYGAEAGNLALKSLSRGGVYLAGGIAAKILPLLQDGLFLLHFAKKGRFSALLRSIPVYVVDCAEIGLTGAIECARQLPAAP